MNSEVSKGLHPTPPVIGPERATAKQCDRSEAPDGWYCTREIGYTHCSHGVSYKNPCAQCDLISAEQTIKSWGRMVDDARALLAAARPEELRKAYGRK